MSRQFSKKKKSLEKVTLSPDAFWFDESEVKRAEALLEVTPNQRLRAEKMFLSALKSIGKIPKSEEIKQRRNFGDLPVESQNYWLFISKELDQ